MGSMAAAPRGKAQKQAAEGAESPPIASWSSRSMLKVAPCGCTHGLYSMIQQWRKQALVALDGSSHAAKMREARLADATDCFDLVNEAWLCQYGSSRFGDISVVEAAIAERRLLVACACDSDTTVAGCILHDSVNEQRILRFGPLAIAPQHQRHGLGSALLSAIADRGL